MNKQVSKEILDILEQLIPNPICELNFNNLFEVFIFAPSPTSIPT